MATQYVFAVGKMIASQPATVVSAAACASSHPEGSRGGGRDIDTRLAELLDWRRETGQELPLPADLILWLEDRGYIIDLLTGCTSRLEPLQNVIDEAAELEDYQEWIADQDYHRSGNW